MASRRTLTADERSEVRAMETMIGIGVLLAGIGVFLVCFALDVDHRRIEIDRSGPSSPQSRPATAR